MNLAPISRCERVERKYVNESKFETKKFQQRKRFKIIFVSVT